MTFARINSGKKGEGLAISYLKKQGYKIIEKKKHLNKDGFKKIIDLVFNRNRVTNKRYSKEILLSRASETIR